MRTSGRFIFLLFTLLFVLPWHLEGNALAIPAVQKTVLPNQLVVLHAEDHSLPFVTLELLINGGARSDPAGQEGLAFLTARGLLLGTSLHSADRINEDIDYLGASIGSSAGRDYSTMTLRVLKKDIDKGLDIFTEVLTKPVFPEEEIAREKKKTLAEIQSEDDQPGDVAEKEFIKTMFRSSPYGHPVNGTKESIPKITRESIDHFYKTYYRPNNCILALSGDISAEEVRTRILPRFDALPAGEVHQPDFTSAFAKGPLTIKINREITQANIIIGNQGISRGNPDFYAVTVMNYVLGGGGFASRLLEEIRNKRGLAYSVESFFDAEKYPGSFQIVLQTKNATAREAISLALQQMDLIRKEPISDKELEGAKKYLVGSFPMRIDTQAKLTDFLLRVQYYDLGLDFPEKYPSLIRAVTKEDVLRVAKKYLHPEDYVLIVVADLKEAGMNTESQLKRTSGQNDFTQHDLGISIDNVSPGLQSKYHLEDSKGIVVTAVRTDSPADVAGIKAGDVILQIDRKPVSSVQEFKSIIGLWEDTRTIELLVKRQGKSSYVVIGSYLNTL
ncbi:MAG TPA: insulinase family protein [Thermodesulfovibrionales bacterium]|nr:insulinase family protein [Thermodesulfovibrionales bacterium]